jgi:hypothetical protein
MLIYIKRKEELFGPYSLDEARIYFESGRLALSDFALPEGSSEWIPLASVLGITSPPPQPPPSVTSVAQNRPSTTSDGTIRAGPVLRDIAVIYVLSAIGGFLLGASTGDQSPEPLRFLWGIAVANILLVTIGFVISGCLARGNRWRHLFIVAAGVWWAGIVNVVFLGVGIVQWLLSSVLIAVLMGVGGGISFVLKKENQTSA